MAIACASLSRPQISSSTLAFCLPCASALFADKNERQSRKPLESIPLLPKERIGRALVGDIGIEIRVLDGNDPRPHRPVVWAQDRKVHAFDVDIHEIELRDAVFFHNTF